MTTRTTNERPRLAVVGASGRIGREVARLAVAYGAEVVGITRAGTPPTDEPWTEGVEWHAGDISSVETAALVDGCHAVIDATSADTLGKARTMDVKRVVEVGCAEAEIPDHLPGNVIHLRVPRLDPAAERGDKSPDKAGVATAHAAMAALRVALEDDHAGTIEPGRVAFLGDAMFLQ